MAAAYWIVAGVGAAAAVLGLLWRPSRAAAREARWTRARRDFHLQREGLEAKFIRLAARRTQSNVVHWIECEFDDDVAYVRNRSTGELAAFVAVTVSVDETYSARGAEDHGNLRIGTAIFRFDHSHWETDGRAILNLNPHEAIRYYQDDLEVVDHEVASGS